MIRQLILRQSRPQDVNLSVHVMNICNTLDIPKVSPKSIKYLRAEVELGALSQINAIIPIAVTLATLD